MVSILSQPEGRELHSRWHKANAFGCFNPLPARRPGATRLLQLYLRQDLSFNPLPARRPGATGTTHSISDTRNCFNPLPARRPGATGTDARRIPRYAGFNPLPARRPGATLRGFSIGFGSSVSILSQPEGRELPGPNSAGCRGISRFNPLPARRPGATSAALIFS